MLIRDENAQDAEAITQVTLAAFRDHPHSHQTEHFIVRALRKAGALSVSLVAEIDGRVVGHAAFSPLVVTDGSPGWYGLGPISVQPELQRQGIGSALLAAGLERLKEMGGQGCALVGDPAFYRRFGFRHTADLTLDGVPPEVFMVLAFQDRIAKGQALFHPAFRATE